MKSWRISMLAPTENEISDMSHMFRAKKIDVIYG